jgi:putative DNA-invertase from lambdoid prophage Rac
MPIYGYARVSTQHQAVFGLSLPEQDRQISQFAEHRLGRSLDELYAEEGVSGTLPFRKRPKGSELFAKLRRGDAVIISKLDRGFRNTADALDTIKRFRHFGVSLYLLDLDICDIAADTGTGLLIFTIFAAIAEFERDRMAERLADRNAQARLRGRALSGTAPYGYRLGGDDNKTLIAIPEEQAVIVRIVDSFDAGFSIVMINKMLARDGIRMSAKRVHDIILRTKGLPRNAPLPNNAAAQRNKPRPKFGLMRLDDGMVVENPDELVAIERIEAWFAEGLGNNEIIARLRPQMHVDHGVISRLRREWKIKQSQPKTRAEGRPSFGWVQQIDGSLVEADYMPRLRQMHAEGASLRSLRDFLRDTHGIEISPQSIMRALRPR